MEALGAVRSLAMWVEAQEDELSMPSELFGQLGHACLFAGAQVSAVPMLVALAADDESGAAEDEVGPAPGAAAERLEGLVFPHGGHVKALGRSSADARRATFAVPVAALVTRPSRGMLECRLARQAPHSWSPAVDEPDAS